MTKIYVFFNDFFNSSFNKFFNKFFRTYTYRSKKYTSLFTLLAIASFFLRLGSDYAFGQNNEKVIRVSLPEFVQKVTQHDPNFPLLLIQELYLKFQHDLQLPASDLVMAVSGQYDLFLPLEKDSNDSQAPANAPWEGSISLQKLFPSSGTTISGQYSNSLYTGTGGVMHRSSVNVAVSQSIVQNCFGIMTRMQEKKITIDNEIVRYQIIEAYEEYLASLIQIFLEWYRIGENLSATQNIYQYNQDLLKIVRRKYQYRIALPEDVQKIRLENIIAAENLDELTNQQLNLEMKIGKMMGFNSLTKIKAQKPSFALPALLVKPVNANLKQTRTWQIYTDSEKSALLARDLADRSLLPEVNAFLGYQAMGMDYDLKNRNQNVYAGFSAVMNFGKQKEKALTNISEIDLTRQRLQSQKNLFDLEIYLSELQATIKKQQKRIELAGERLSLAKSILAAERNNYNIGKKALNDLIIAKKAYENAHYDKISQEMVLQSLTLEWLKNNDILVSENKKVHKALR